MPAALPTSYQDRVAFIIGALTPLPRRKRLAVAVAALDRCFEVIANCPLDVAPAETAWELARLVAAGGEVPIDEAKWAMRAVDEAEDDATYDLTGVEGCVARVVWYLADALKDPAGDVEAVTSSLEALLDGADGAKSDEEEVTREFAWIAELLAAAVTPPGAQLDAGFFALGTGRAPRWVVRAGTRLDDDDDDPADLEAQTRALVAERPAAALARAARVAARRHTAPVNPFRAANGIPERFVVAEVGRGDPASEGKIAVSGARHYALFSCDDETTAPFAPPESVALGMTVDETTLLSWRVTRRPGVSGIARGHYQWTLEIYAWPATTLIDSHVVTAQEVIAWCTPVALEVPAVDGKLVVVMRARSEDSQQRVTIVRGEDGSFSETVA
jgi:hypothetical protein